MPPLKTQTKVAPKPEEKKPDDKKTRVGRPDDAKPEAKKDPEKK